MKKGLLLAALAATSINLAHASCDYTPNKDDFAFSFTAYGAPDKSYVVTKNTFTEYELASSTGKLVGASIEIDTNSLDTSHDLNDGNGGLWSDSFPMIRNSNVINGLFNNFVNPGKITATVKSIDATTVQLEVTMNGETKVVPMEYKVEAGKLAANGTLEIMDFNGSEAFAMFEAICTLAFHQGKSWSDIAIEFSVPVTEVGCG